MGPDLSVLPRRVADSIQPEPMSGCWLWSGPATSRGYGTTHVNGRPWLVHRLMHDRFVGPIPDGHAVMHKCDVPSCCNPAHLRTGTNVENHLDMMLKGRGRGVRKRIELTDEQKRIALGLAGSMPILQIATIVGAGKNKVQQLIASVRGTRVYPPRTRKEVTEAQIEVIRQMAGMAPTKQIAQTVGLGKNRVCSLMKEMI